VGGGGVGWGGGGGGGAGGGGGGWGGGGGGVWGGGGGVGEKKIEGQDRWRQAHRYRVGVDDCHGRGGPSTSAEVTRQSRCSTARGGARRTSAAMDFLQGAAACVASTSRAVAACRKRPRGTRRRPAGAVSLVRARSSFRSSRDKMPVRIDHDLALRIDSRESGRKRYAARRQPESAWRDRRTARERDGRPRRRFEHAVQMCCSGRE